MKYMAAWSTAAHVRNRIVCRADLILKSLILNESLNKDVCVRVFARACIHTCVRVYVLHSFVRSEISSVDYSLPTFGNDCYRVRRWFQKRRWKLCSFHFILFCPTVNR